MRRRWSVLVMVVMVAMAAAAVPASAAGNDYNKYELVEVLLDWKDARKAAKTMVAEGCETAHLATITSQDELKFLDTLMTESAENAWLGGFQTGKTLGEKWRWVTNEAWNYVAWASAEPNDTPDDQYMPGSEQYLEALKEISTWNDAPGYEEKYFVVESEECAD